MHRNRKSTEGLNKGRGRLSNFYVTPSTEKAVNAKPNPLCYRRVFGQSYLASFLSGQQTLGSHWLDEIREFYAGIFD